MLLVAKRFPGVMFPVMQMLRPPAISTNAPGAKGVLTTATLSAASTTMAQLLIDATCKETSIDNNDLTRHKARSIRGQEDRGSRQFLDFPEAFHWRSHQELLAASCAIQELFIQRCAKYAGCNGIHTDTSLRPFHSERFRQRSQRGLTGGIRCHFIQRDKGPQRSDVDDSAVAALQHRWGKDLARPQNAGEIGIHNGLPILFRKRQSWLALGSSRRVHENVHVAEGI